MTTTRTSMGASEDFVLSSPDDDEYDRLEESSGGDSSMGDSSGSLSALRLGLNLQPLNTTAAGTREISPRDALELLEETAHTAPPAPRAGGARSGRTASEW
jgi:hypothetical protein